MFRVDLPFLSPAPVVGRHRCGIDDDARSGHGNTSSLRSLERGSDADRLGRWHDRRRRNGRGDRLGRGRRGGVTALSAGAAMRSSGVRQTKPSSVPDGETGAQRSLMTPSATQALSRGRAPRDQATRAPRRDCPRSPRCRPSASRRAGSGGRSRIRGDERRSPRARPTIHAPRAPRAHSERRFGIERRRARKRPGAAPAGPRMNRRGGHADRPRRDRDGASERKRPRACGSRDDSRPLAR